MSLSKIVEALQEQLDTPPEDWRHCYSGQTWQERCEAWTEFALDKLEDELTFGLDNKI